MQAPNLLALQTESFDWLVGNERWRERMTAANKAHPGSLPETSGLEEIFDEISPIEDFGETMALSFHDHRFEEPKYTAEECQEKDLTYSAPLYVVADFENFSTFVPTPARDAEVPALVADVVASSQALASLR